MSGMTSVLHEMISVLHQSVSINAKGGYCWLKLVVIDVNPWINPNITKEELHSGPLMVKAFTERRFVDWVILEVWLENSDYLWNNEMNVNEFVSETILDG